MTYRLSKALDQADFNPYWLRDQTQMELDKLASVERFLEEVTSAVQEKDHEMLADVHGEVDKAVELLKKKINLIRTAAREITP